MDREKLIDTLVAFVKQIGINVEFGKVPPEKEFLPGLCIHKSSLLIDKEKLKHPGDILHEAGHLAVAPPSKRITMDGKLDGNNDQDMGEEMMSIAWSYAAAIHLGIDPHIVFHEEGYKGSGESIVQNFAEGKFFAVSLLQWTGLAYEAKTAESEGAEPFPKMRRWLREHELTQET